MIRSRSVLVYFSLVFAGGIGVGAFSHRLYSVRTVEAVPPRRTPEEFRRKLIEEMQTRLSLSPEQLAKVNEILDDSRAKFREVSARFDPEMKAIREQQIERTRAVLSDAQKAEYEKFLAERKAERDKMRKQMGGRGPNHGPGC